MRHADVSGRHAACKVYCTGGRGNPHQGKVCHDHGYNNEYLRQKRVHLAKQFLSNTHQSISWISQAVGYGDIKYFSHIFREQVHMMPSEYRLKSLDEGK